MRNSTLNHAALAVLLASLFAVPFASGDAVQDLVAGLQAPTPEARTAAWQNAGPVGAAGVPAVADLMTAADPEVARCATEALGKIVYHAGRPGADAERVAVAQALAGLLDPKYSDTVRHEALYLMSLIGGDPEAPTVALLLQNETLADRACLTLERMPGEASTLALLNALPTVSSQVQLRVIASLAHKSDERIAPILVQLAQTAGGETAWACVDTLARMGVSPIEFAPFVPKTSPEDRRRYANILLTAAQVCAEKGNRDLAERLYTSVSTFHTTRDQACGALVGLKEMGSEKLIEHALGYLAEPGIYPTAIQMLKESQLEDLNDKLVRRFAVTNPYSKARIVEILAARSAPQLAELLPVAVKDGSAEVRVAARKAAGEPPDAADLFEAGTKCVPWLREDTLREYLQIAEERAQSGQTDEARAMFENVAKAGTTAQLRIEALTQLEPIATDASLGLVEELMKDDAVAVAATRVYVAVIAKGADKGKAIDALTKLADFETEPDTLAFAAHKLQELGADVSVMAKRRGFITKWSILGPFPNENNSAFNKAIIPADAIDLSKPINVDGKDYAWKEVSTPSLPAVIDLKAQFDPNQNVAAYAFATINTPQAMPAVLLIGSDDGCEVWVNGAQVHAVDAPRGLKVDQDAVDIDLKEGANTVLVKILQGAVNWEFSVRLAQPGGTPLDLSAQP